MGDIVLMNDDAAARAYSYREKAEEIRRVARVANSLDIVRDLLETALRFNQMAAYVEKSLLEAAD